MDDEGRKDRRKKASKQGGQEGRTLCTELNRTTHCLQSTDRVALLNESNF